MGGNNSITVFGDLSKPATVLIEKIADATGGICRPMQIKRVAKAEAESAKIKALANIEIDEIKQRALQRFVLEETRKQENMENITKKAIPLLDENSNPNDIENDWIVQFYEKCRLVSDDEMQDIWANILAGESNTPGKFSIRTINFMATLDKRDAEKFMKLCRYNWVIGNHIIPLIFEPSNKIYSDNGVNFELLTHLDSIGLIQFSSLAGFKLNGTGKQWQIYYGSKAFTVEFPQEGEITFETGKVLLSQVGIELSQICKAQVIPEFSEYVIEKLKSRGLTVVLV